jgi:hypothetical protein
MGTVWTFGDSLTEGFKSGDLWARTYVEWKGYIPMTYGEIVADRLGYQIINLGKGGSDNYTIFETFSKNINKFEQDDIVIIGWSDTSRFRLSNSDGHWTSIIPNFSNDLNYIDNVSQNTIDEILVNRTSKIYIEEINYWINVIKKSLGEIKFISWSTFNNGKIKGLFIHEKIELIKTETNGEINDAHFSELGQRTVAETIIGNILDLNNKQQKLI